MDNFCHFGNSYCKRPLVTLSTLFGRLFNQAIFYRMALIIYTEEGRRISKQL